MSFTSYASRADVDLYIPNITHQLWESEGADVDASLVKAARKINEFLRGLNRIPDADIPIIVEADGGYPEALIELNVYSAVWMVVTGTMAGEAFEDHGSWVAAKVRDLKDGIRDGEYTFGTGDSDLGTSGSVVSLGRVSI